MDTAGSEEGWKQGKHGKLSGPEKWESAIANLYAFPPFKVH